MVGLEDEAFVGVAVMEKYTSKDQLLGAMQCAWGECILTMDVVLIRVHVY